MEKKQEKPFKTKFFTPYKNYIFASLSLIFALIFIFSFTNKAGVVGSLIKKAFLFLLGNTIYIIPLILLTAFFLLLSKRNPYSKKEKYLGFLLIAFLLESATLFGIAELEFIGANGFNLQAQSLGGVIGYLLSFLMIKGFGFWVALSIITILIITTLIILLEPLFKKEKLEQEEIVIKKPTPKKKMPFLPRFKKTKKEKEPILKEAPKIKTFSPYEAPPLNLLSKRGAKPESGDIKLNASTIQKTLFNFGIQVDMGEVNVGPTVSQYTLKPAKGIKLSRITNLANNLALDLATESIRIEAPIPGKALVGIEIPNKKRAIVSLYEMLASKHFRSSESPLFFALGKDVKGELVYADLGEMPHLLVGGTTGSGKSICLNCIILSLMYRNSHEDMQFVMIDPKKVELLPFNPINHLMCPVIANPDEAIIALKWLVGEMESRFETLKNAGNRDISSYNKSWKQGMEKMPYIVVIIDELADLMMARGKEIESYIVRLAQKARAVGIHLVLATQRPSVEVITGLIKANISSRISFKVASQVDSRTMLDVAGAEKLLGKGDFLFQSKDTTNLKRIQGPFVSEKEIKNVVSFIESKKLKEDLENPEKFLEIESKKEHSLKAVLEEAISSPSMQIDQFLRDEDPLYEQAKQIVIKTKKASTSYLQRKLKIGYARAARIIDALEEGGIVGPQDGSRQREVYIKDEQD